MDLIGKIGGTPDFSSYAPGGVSVGAWLTAVISFVHHGHDRLLLHRDALHEGQGEVLPGRGTGTPADVAVLEEIRDLLRARNGQV